MQIFRFLGCALAILSAPVFMGSVTWGLSLLRDYMPLWLWALMMLCNVIAVVGVASLIDTRREQQGLPPL